MKEEIRNEETRTEVELELTKRGLPALWEWGGGFTNTGEAQVVAGPHGEALKPLYVRRKGHLANQEHALFVVYPGCFVIRGSHHRKDFEVDVFRVEAINVEEKKAILRRIANFSEGEWDIEPPEFLVEAIQEAADKATCYHCREPHFANLEEPRLLCWNSSLRAKLLQP
jgi:hypothetical protein